MKSFLILLEDKQKQLLNDKLLLAHINYLKNLRQQGFLPICGPKKDNQGAILMVRANSLEHAQALICNDPFIQEGYYHQFNIYEFEEAHDENNWLANSIQTNHQKLKIDEALVHRLIDQQFPQWKHLALRSVHSQGWDNRTFHLGENMLVRMPSDADYALQVAKEQHWLPILAPLLPLPISSPIAMGEPNTEYPWHWSIYRYLPGKSASIADITDQNQFAKKLAEFLSALQKINSTNGPVAGLHSFHRGGLLATYDTETRQAIAALKDKIDADIITEIWEAALQTTWDNSPVWVHGDVSPGNLLVNDGQLSAVIDFGQLAIGDPACDLAIAWTFFKKEAREIFRNHLNLDDATWLRGRAWTLWKALIVAAEIANSNNVEATKCWDIIDEVISDK